MCGVRVVVCAVLTRGAAAFFLKSGAQRSMELSGSSAASGRGDVISDAIRAADSASLVAELKRRGIDTVDDKKQSHVVGELRPKDEFSDARAAALDTALEKLGTLVTCRRQGSTLVQWWFSRHKCGFAR